jgi:hypothetical protein
MIKNKKPEADKASGYNIRKEINNNELFTSL